MVNVGHVYSEYATNFLQDAESKSNTHHVIEFDRNTTRFRVEEIVNPREVRPAEKFVVRLDERWCNCGKFQKIHLPCSHVIAACKHAYHDFNMYISLHYRLHVIMKVYDNLFGELRHEEYWLPYQGHKFGLILPQKGARVVVLNQVELGLISTLRKEDNKKSVHIVELKDTQEIIVLIILHLDDPHQTT